MHSAPLMLLWERNLWGNSRCPEALRENKYGPCSVYLIIQQLTEVVNFIFLLLDHEEDFCFHYSALHSVMDCGEGLSDGQT